MSKTVTRTDAFVRSAMRAHGSSVLRLALSQTGSRADAEDVYQDVFVALACSDVSFVGDDHLRAWLLRVTLNRCRDLARSWWRQRSTSLDALELDWPSPDEKDAQPDAAVLWKAVQNLPERYRPLVHLHYVEEMSYEEIAAVTGIKPSTVRTRLSRAHKKLKTMLGGEDEAL